MNTKRLSLSVAILASLATQQVRAQGACLIDPVAVKPNLVTSVFGKTRNLPQYAGSPHIHWGVDFQARSPRDPSTGADLVAASGGTVIGAGFWGSGYGNRVAIKRDNGDILIYSHMSKIEPRLKGGSGIGFKDAQGGAKIGTEKVAAGDKIGVAGGTANHMSSDERPIHLHLEYVTGYGGSQIRETNDGTNATRSKYMRNVEDYMCNVPQHAPGAGSATTPPAAGKPTVESARVAQPASTNPQADTAAKIQPKVEVTERYGVPDAPPYDSYGGLSESQIIEAEMLRRTLDTEWEEKLTGWSKRGLWVEISRIDGVLLWLDQRISEKKSRVEAMLATLVARKADTYFSPRLSAMRERADRISAAKKVD